MATYLDAVIAVLEEEGGPLHYREIARRAREGGMIPETRSMAANVLKAINRHLGPPRRVFAKVAPGVYALGPGSGGGGPAPPPTGGPATYLDAAVAVLEGEGGPLHYREIARRAREGGMIPETRSMAANVLKAITTRTGPPGRVFAKVAPGVYALGPGRRGGGPAPDMAYSEYLYRGAHGSLVRGRIGHAVDFMFCEKDRRLLRSGLEGGGRPSALYALLDAVAGSVYVGVTRRGRRRIEDHWKRGFTHVGVVSGPEHWSTDLRLCLEHDLTEIFRSMSWGPTNQSGEVELGPHDMHAREELARPLRHAAARIGFLARSMGDLYPGPARAAGAGGRGGAPQSGTPSGRQGGSSAAPPRRAGRTA